MNWELVWKVTLIGALAAFAGMSVLVTIFGAMDIRKLLRQLEAVEDRKPAKDEND